MRARSLGRETLSRDESRDERRLETGPLALASESSLANIGFRV